MILGGLLFVLSRYITEWDLGAGLLLGISVGNILVGILVTVRSFVQDGEKHP